ncbi:hypothetical protein KHU50_002012 [Colletotrichum sp. SAR 10_65]|nr:hypothetical protein K4K51_006703 [Colletotrichum sp. SAR 10_75]KAI8184016.1 hypothetical protein KHU50_002012 [Colletotrichum sp. SAR 10_65]KAJ4995417.1 hypothetical protein K4K48_010405 [Colletotrichum sp. SAR 10_66]
MSLFEGVAVVTGAASGIGRQVAVSFAREGCKRIALLDKDEEGLSETSRRCREANGDTRTFVIEIDNRNEDDVSAGMEYVTEEWGRIDYAVNCAGMFGPKAPSHLLTTAEFDEITTTNYRGTWLCSKAELSQMIKQEPLKTHDAAYSASKAAILSLTKSDAVDHSDDK